MPGTVRKAIFPVGGLGTRFLPATKSMPKEMLPVVDKPLIQYAVEEAANAGIEEFIFVMVNRLFDIQHFNSKLVNYYRFFVKKIQFFRTSKNLININY